MRGLPNSPVPCNKCGDPNGYPSIGLCNRCRGAAGKRKYIWTPDKEEYLRRIYEQHIHNKLELSEALRAFAKRLGWPAGAVKWKAGRLGLTHDIRRPWTPEEIAFIREHLGSKPLSFFKKELRRTHHSIRSMIDKLQLSYRITEGYSQQDLQALFGISWNTLTRWLQKRWLRPISTTGRIPESQVIRFIKAHPEEFRLKRVDEVWFKGLLFPMMGKMFIGRKDTAA